MSWKEYLKHTNLPSTDIVEIIYLKILHKIPAMKVYFSKYLTVMKFYAVYYTDFYLRVVSLFYGYKFI